MSDPARALFEKAERAIHAAEILLKDGDADFAVGRAYYAMLYVAEALLLMKGLRFREHGSVHAAFGENFAELGVPDRSFIDGYWMRMTNESFGDYGFDVSLTTEDGTRVIGHAREFLQAARMYLSAT